ncbi:MAG: DUF362 domain-containing protein, partial [bacterium]
MDRREFLITTAAGATALLLPWKLYSAEETPISLVVVTGGVAGTALQTALQALGGIGQFRVQGKKVAVKPNIGWDRTPAQAANTDPDLVAAVVKAFKSQKADV